MKKFFKEMPAIFIVAAIFIVIFWLTHLTAKQTKPTFPMKVIEANEPTKHKMAWDERYNKYVPDCATKTTLKIRTYKGDDDVSIQSKRSFKGH